MQLDNSYTEFLYQHFIWVISTLADKAITAAIKLGYDTPLTSGDWAAKRTPHCNPIPIVLSVVPTHCQPSLPTVSLLILFLESWYF